nr:DUF5825 family protein [Brevibacillus humidisoli]
MFAPGAIPFRTIFIFSSAVHFLLDITKTPFDPSLIITYILSGVLWGQYIKQIQLMRDSQSLGIKMYWEGVVTEKFDFYQLFHMVPPIKLDVPGYTNLIEEWHQNYRYGSFYYRKGPSFLLIKDTRLPENSCRFVIDELPLLNIVYQCLTPQHRDQINEGSSYVEQLVNEGILLEYHDYLITLPYRVLKWPIPYDAI